MPFNIISETEIIKSKQWFGISLLAFIKCEFNSSESKGIICGFIQTNSDKHTWKYNQEKGIIVITTINTTLKNI